MNDTVPLETRLEEMFEPLASELGLELVSVELKGGKGRRLLQVAADRPQGGVKLDDCVRLSREISALLDVEDPIPGAFELQVTSPGVERPLRRAKEFARFAGRDVLVRYREAGEIRQVEGRLEGINAHEQVLVNSGAETWEVPLSSIEKAKLTFQFGSQRKKR